jgi:hypothetical protein
MDLYSSVNLDRGIYGHMTGMERGVPIYSSVKGASQYISQLHVTKEYICRLCVTEEYTFIFLGADEYNDIYSSTLYSSVISSVN